MVCGLGERSQGACVHIARDESNPMFLFSWEFGVTDNSDTSVYSPLPRQILPSSILSLRRDHILTVLGKRVGAWWPTVTCLVGWWGGGLSHWAIGEKKRLPA